MNSAHKHVVSISYADVRMLCTGIRIYIYIYVYMYIYTYTSVPVCACSHDTRIEQPGRANSRFSNHGQQQDSAGQQHRAS